MVTRSRTVHIGCGAGFAGDRFDAGEAVVATLKQRDGPRYLTFEVLAERTLALALRARRDDPALGYSPFVDHYLRPVLEDCLRHGIRIVSNLGAANPAGAAARIHALAAELELGPIKVAVVAGDDLLEHVSAAELAAMPTMEGLETGTSQLVAANAYIGARPIADALALGADIVVTGRCADAALILGPLLHEFGWKDHDWDRLAAGTLAGHLLECGAQVTGAYFADPGYKDVPDLAHVGFPIAALGADGDIVMGKADNTGGCVTPMTVKEQLLYEMHDPAAYLTPDVVLDVTGVELDDLGDDRVRVRGARGKPRPPTLKATLSMDGGWLGEAEMSYSGPNALARAQLAIDVIQTRWRDAGHNTPLRADIIGALSVHGGDEEADSGGAVLASPATGDYRIRLATRALNRAGAEKVCHEVLHLYCSGPAGGGGFRQHIGPQIRTASVLVPRERVSTSARLVPATEAAP